MIVTHSTIGESFRDSCEDALSAPLHRPELFVSPRWQESGLCGSLAVWETVVTGSMDEYKWRDYWIKYRKLAHPRHPEWLLSDTPALTMIKRPSPDLVHRAFRRVRIGMQRVVQKVVLHYRPQANSKWLSWAELTNKVIKHHLFGGHITDDPESLEARLLSQTQWLEWFLRRGVGRDGTLSMWRAEIRRTRKFGPPSTKTFSTMSSLEDRIKEEHVLQKEMHKAYKQLAHWMGKVIADLSSYLLKGNGKLVS
jgi:hypothetical protein